jgi:CO/xanthine dehydrogenase Mo-binding subunit
MLIVNDCGRVFNPMTAEGQLLGGVVHGIGNSIFEWYGPIRQRPAADDQFRRLSAAVRAGNSAA